MGADVFISYARGSSLPHARALRDRLQSEGIDVFHDERSIDYGSSFPRDLAQALEDARLVVVLLDGTYFGRPWCAYEFDVLTSAYRTEGQEASLDHVIVALPAAGDCAPLLAQLPPPLASRSWPTVDAVAPIAALVRERLGTALGRLGDTLATVSDDAVERLRGGGDIALAWPRAGRPQGASSVRAALSPRSDAALARAALRRPRARAVAGRACTRHPARTRIEPVVCAAGRRRQRQVADRGRVRRAVRRHSSSPAESSGPVAREMTPAWWRSGAPSGLGSLRGWPIRQRLLVMTTPRRDRCSATRCANGCCNTPRRTRCSGSWTVSRKLRAGSPCTRARGALPST